MLIQALIAIGCFCSAFAIDATTAWYTRACAQGRIISASNASVLAYAAGCIGFLGFLEAGWWVVPWEVAGLWLGTYWTMRREVAAGEKPV